MNLLPSLVLALSPPAWLNDPGADHLSVMPAVHNWAIQRLPAFARDMHGTGVGHAMAYEAMARGETGSLETNVFDRIDRVLHNPPRNPVDEASISPTFIRQYGALEKVFDWAHLLHFQTIDVLIHPGWSQARRDQEIEKLWRNYQSQPYALTGLPMNMEFLSSSPYDGAFRRAYPKVNGLFWGYHWLQTAAYDMLYEIEPRDQISQYGVLGDQYRRIELYRTNRDFMPMTAEMSPRFSKRFPMIANAFDNLHMLHDNVNDILSQSWDKPRKQAEVKAAIVRVLASTHAGEEPTEGEGLHDHEHAPSVPGMGKMKGSDGDIMFMSGMGWMDMSRCAHCSIPLPEETATVSANGWTMVVRCLACARDMAAETPGQAIIRTRIQDSSRTLVMISDEEGKWQSNIPGVVFLEQAGEHPECADWSRAFATTESFDAFVKENQVSGALPLSLQSWSERNLGRPPTYRKIDRPNPYGAKY